MNCVIYSGVGCYWAVGALCYANDIALLLPCSSAMIYKYCYGYRTG